MDTWLIILITLVVVGSGIYYMSLLSDKSGRRLWKKKMVLTCLLLFLAGAGLFACFSGLLDQKEFRDTVWYLALFMMGAGGLLLLRLVLMRKKTDEEEEAPKEREERELILPKRPATRKDLLFLLLLTIVYGILVFWRLGSSKVPITFQELEAKGQEDELVLDLGEEMEVAQISIYLGHMTDRVVSVSWYDEEQGKWIPLEEEITMESIYNWNVVPVHQKLRYLGVVSRNGSAIYHEIIIEDEEGKRLLPQNRDVYPNLFDEQELYPEELTYYYCTMFDEVHYAGSAYEFLKGMPMHEQTHPPMGKYLIALGEILFGVTPLGWRFVCALLGVLLVPVFYWFLQLLTENAQVSLVGSALFCMDFMHLTLSRIATLDSLVAFFILLMAALFLKLLKMAAEEISCGRKGPSAKVLCLMLLDGAAVGMAVSTKWTGFYAMLGMALCFLGAVGVWCCRAKRKGTSCRYSILLLAEGIGVYSVIPFVIYLLSFVPVMKALGEKNLFQVMWKVSVFMLDFHSGITFEHPYACAWYTWVLDRIPLVDAAAICADGKVSLVATFGNPIIWWGGLGAFFYLLVRTIRKRDRVGGALCFCYLTMLAPWLFVTRTVFIYQYYVSSIFLCGIAAYVLCLLSVKWKRLLPLSLDITFFVFIIFFPILSGWPVSVYHVGVYLQWLRTWKFV